MPDNAHLLMIFLAIVALSVLIQAGVLLGILITALKASRALNQLTDDFRETVVPMLQTTREVVDRLAPKIEIVANRLVVLGERLGSQGAELEQTATEISLRLRQQSRRLDHMLTRAMDGVDRTAEILSNVVQAPVRQLSAFYQALRAVVESFREPTAKKSQTPSGHSAADREHFV